jgi:hypothetical protein
MIETTWGFYVDIEKQELLKKEETIIFKGFPFPKNQSSLYQIKTYNHQDNSGIIIITKIITNILFLMVIGMICLI